MTFVKRLLKTNKKVGLVFVQQKGLHLQARCEFSNQLYWEKFVPNGDIESYKKISHTDIPKTAGWMMIIPAYQCITRYIILPSTDRTEIEKMLEFELPNIVSYNTRPWVWDFSIVGGQKDGSSKILVVLSPMTIIENYTETLLSLGIKPDIVTTSAMFYTFLLSKQEALPESGPAGCFCLNDDHIDFCVVENGQVEFLRGIRLTSRFCENSKLAETEINRSLSMVKKHKFTSCPDRFFVINTNSDTAGFVRVIEEVTGVRVKKIGPAELYSKQSPIIDSLMSIGLNGHLSSASWKAPVNLLPRPLKEKRLRSSKRRQTMQLALKVCFVVFLAFLCLKVSVWRKNRILDGYKQRLSAISPVAEKLQFQQQQLTIIENQLQGNILTLDIIFELYKSLPKDITIHYLDIEQNKKIRTRAQAKLLSQSFDCIGPLEQSDFFQNVRQSYANQRQIEDSVLIDFEIVADLQNPPDRKLN